MFCHLDDAFMVMLRRMSVSGSSQVSYYNTTAKHVNRSKRSFRWNSVWLEALLLNGRGDVGAI